MATRWSRWHSSTLASWASFVGGIVMISAGSKLPLWQTGLGSFLLGYAMAAARDAGREGVRRSINGGQERLRSQPPRSVN